MRKAKISNDDFVYFFDTLSEMEQFTDRTLASIPHGSYGFKQAEAYIVDPAGKVKDKIKTNGISWFGTDDTSWVGKPIEMFLKIDGVMPAVEKLRSVTTDIDIIDIDQQKRVEFTEREIGVFSFDLASLGLIRVYEYWSPLLKRVVDADSVEGKSIRKKQYFYFKGQAYIPRHQVRYDIKRGGYYSNFLKRVVDSKELDAVEQPTASEDVYFYFYPEQVEIPEHEVEQRQKVVDGKPVFSTTFKKSFIRIEKVQNTLPRIDLIVPLAYQSNVKADSVFWNTIAVLAICEKLDKANVNYRVIAAKCNSTMKKGTVNKNIFNFFNLKNENQTLDSNQMSTIISDTRFYRMKLFQLVFASQYDSGNEMKMVGDGIAYTIDDVDKIKDAYLSYLSLQTSETDRDAATRPDSKVVVPLALTEMEAKDAYDTVIAQISKVTP